VSDCSLTPNEQYEELDISKNSGKHYKNTNFDKEDILANHKSINCIVFGLTRPGLEPTIYSTRGEHTNHYGIDAWLLVVATTRIYFVTV
jgi:hypothetical protein